MNITTRKRRSRKGVKWINHFYSKWYRKRLALGGMLAASVIASGCSQLHMISATTAKTPEDQKRKAFAIAQCVINTNVAALKAANRFI